MPLSAAYAQQEHQRLAQYLSAQWREAATNRLTVVDWAIAVMEAHRACPAVEREASSAHRGAVALRGIERLEQWLEAHGSLEAKDRNLISEVVERVLILLAQSPRCVCETEAPPVPGGYY